MKSLKFWKPMHFDVTSYKWLLKERKGTRFFGSGSDYGNKNTYTYNEYGFRGDSTLKNGFKIMSIGSSYTEGIGVNDDETYSHYLSKMIEDGVDLNFGYSGRSNDYIARVLITFFDKINPDFVNIMYTYPNHREYYTNTNGIEPYAPNPWGYYKEHPTGKREFDALNYVLNSEDDFINWYKNHLLIINYLKNKNVPFVWNGTFLQTEYMDENRFDGDYPYFEDDSNYAKAIDNKNYAQNLYKHLEKIGVIKNY
jgi:hypothetical protein